MEQLDSSLWNEQVRKSSTENTSMPKLIEISHSLKKVTKSTIDIRFCREGHASMKSCYKLIKKYRFGLTLRHAYFTD